MRVWDGLGQLASRRLRLQWNHRECSWQRGRCSPDFTNRSGRESRQQSIGHRSNHPVADKTRWPHHYSVLDPSERKDSLPDDQRQTIQRSTEGTWRSGVVSNPRDKVDARKVRVKMGRGHLRGVRNPNWRRLGLHTEWRISSLYGEETASG